MLNKLLLTLVFLSQMCFSVFAQTSEWHLIWDTNQEDDMSYYKIFRSTNSPAYTEYNTVQHPTNGDMTVSFLDNQLDRGTQYFYRIKAVNSSQAESEFSFEVSAAIPDMSDLPASISLADGETTYLQLDDYVADPDHSDSELQWEVSGVSQLQVSINLATRVATIVAPNPWTSQEVLTFTVTDPDSFYDVKSLSVFSGLAAPEITFSTPVSFNEDESEVLDLNDHVNDSDTPLQNLYWQGGSSNSHLTVSIDQSSKQATIRTDENWNGSATLWLKVMDTEFQSDSVEIQVLVNAVNDPPVISGLPNMDLSENKSQQITLNNYVNDVDNSSGDLYWYYTGNTNVSVQINSENIAQVSVSSEWSGQETITLIAQDPQGARDTSSIVVFSQNSQIAPTLTGISSTSLSEDGTGEFDFSGHVADADNNISELTWTFADFENLSLSFDNASNVLTIVPDANWYGSESISIKVEDPDQNIGFATLSVNVTSVNDIPVFIKDIGMVTFNSGSFKTLDLKDKIDDADGLYDIEKIELFHNENQYIGYFIDEQNLEITFFSAPQYYGGQTFQLKITDSAGAQPPPKTFMVTSERTNITSPVKAVPFGGTSDILLSWQTATATMDFIEYGFDVSYGQRTAIDEDYVETHTAVLTDLNDATKYHFRIVSKDSDNFTWFSQDSTFETGIVSDKINAFPIPFRRSEGGEGIYFTNLPENGEVQIYTLAGNIIFRKNNMSPFLIWNARNKSGKKIGSGLYLYVIKNSSNKKVASGKLIIIN